MYNVYRNQAAVSILYIATEEGLSIDRNVWHINVLFLIGVKAI